MVVVAEILYSYAEIRKPHRPLSVTPPAGRGAAPSSGLDCYNDRCCCFISWSLHRSYIYIESLVVVTSSSSSSGSSSSSNSCSSCCCSILSCLKYNMGQVFKDNINLSSSLSKSLTKSSLCSLICYGLCVWNDDLLIFVPDIPVTESTTPYPCCAPFSRITFAFHLRRKPLYYVTNLIIPCCLLSFMAVATFVLQPSCSERLGLSKNHRQACNFCQMSFYPVNK